MRASRRRGTPRSPVASPPVPAPLAAGDADARSRILAAAAEEFSAIGFAGARVDAIAEKAGVNKAMLYYHVGGKKELYEAVLVTTIEKAHRLLREAVDPEASPREKLGAVVATLARLGAENPVFIPIIFREIAAGGENLPDEMVVRMGAVFRLVAEILAEGAASGEFRRVDPLLTHVTLVGSIMFCVASQPVRQRVARLLAMPVPKHAPKELAAHVGDLFLDGLAERGREGRKR